MKPFIWPVYGFAADRRYKREFVASFFEKSDAETFAMHPEQGFEQRNLYVAEPSYDRRKAGYRPASAHDGYAEFLASLIKPVPYSRMSIETDESGGRMVA